MDNFIINRIKEVSRQGQIAVAFGDEFISYKELDEKSDLVAWEIYRKINGTQKIPVVIYEPRGIEFIIHIIAVLKCGCFYIPIEPSIPLERVISIYNDVGASLIISNMDIDCDDLSVLKIDSSLECHDIFEYSEISNDDLIYIIYTSGTSGKPKGVKIMYRNLYNLLQSFYDILYHHFSSPVNIGVMAAFSFDASVKQIYAALYFGHTLVIAKENVKAFGRKIHNFHNKYNIAVCDCTPSHLKLMLNQRTQNCSKVKYLLIGGEKLNWVTLKEYAEKHLYVPTFINVYGPTECCVDSSYYIVGDDYNKEGSVPIGSPLKNTKLLLIDDDGFVIDTPQKIGELWIEGEQVGDGYVKADNSSFIVNSEGKKYIYKTGDLVMYNNENEIIVISRKDRQTKINGFRIELDEITNLIDSFIKDTSYVMCHNNELYAYITCKDKTEELKNFLTKMLPNYMLPKRYIAIGKIPLTYNGKVDEKKLLKMLD